jgi:hypothetical protein
MTVCVALCGVSIAGWAAPPATTSGASLEYADIATLQQQ